MTDRARQANAVGDHLCAIHGYDERWLADRMAEEGLDADHPATAVMWVLGFHLAHHVQANQPVEAGFDGQD